MHDQNVMAGRLLWVGVAALLVQGCLIPQDTPVLPDLPQKKNTTPTLLISSASPDKPKGNRINLSSGCNACEKCRQRPFSIGVEDPDLGDEVTTRWFVDDANFTSVPLNGKGLSNVSEKRGIAKPVEQLYTMTKLTVSGLHDVTVVVADRQFPPEGIEMSVEQIPLPDGGFVEYRSSTSQYTWEVFTDLNACDCKC